MTKAQHTPGLFTKLADAAAKKIKPEHNLNDIRDICDIISGGDLDTTQLDILVDMVDKRAIRLVNQPIEYTITFFGDYRAEIKMGDGEIISISGSPILSSRIARLIAAAPELLEANNQLIAMLDGWIAEGSLNPEPRSNMKRIMDEARAAITKAKGE